MTTFLTSTGPQTIINAGSKDLPKIQGVTSFVLFLWYSETTVSGTTASKGPNIDLQDE